MYSKEGKVVKTYEMENKGFFDSVVFYAHKRLRILYSMVRRNLVDWFDTYRFYLTLIALYFFFGYILPLPAMLLGFHYGGTFAYIWLGSWSCVFALLAYREDKRHKKAQSGYFKWVNNSNAMKEWVEHWKPKDK